MHFLTLLWLPFGDTDKTLFDLQYIVIPVFFIMLFGWKLLKKTTFVRLDDMDFDSGKRQRESLRSSPSSLTSSWC